MRYYTWIRVSEGVFVVLNIVQLSVVFGERCL